MSDQLIEKIYNITKKYKDPVSNVALDKDNKSFSVITKNGNISISLSIESQKGCQLYLTFLVPK